VLFFYWGPKGPWLDASGRDNSDFSYGVDDWTASAAGLSISPSEDRAHNETGYGSMLLASTGAGLYAYHVRGISGIRPEDQWFLPANVIIVEGNGPVTWEIWNYTGNVWVSRLSSIASAQGEGARLHLEPQNFGVSAGVYKLNARIGVPSGTTVAVDCVPGHELHETYWKTPAWLTQNWRLQGLQEADYGRGLSDNTYSLRAKTYKAWEPNLDYTPENFEEDANPNALQLMEPRRGLPAKELWYAGQRQMSDRVTFEDDYETIHVDEDIYKAALLAEAGRALESRDQLGPNGKWMRLVFENEVTLAAQKVVRRPPAVRPQATRVRTAL
jgi:hypothetical protein